MSGMDVYEAAGVAGEGPRCGACPADLFRHEVGQGRVVCGRCETRLLTALNDTEALWARLPGFVVKGTPLESGRSGGGGGGSAAPGNLAVYSLLAGEAVDRLIVWEDDWRRTLGWQPAPPRGGQDATLRGVVRFLRDHVPWAVCADGPGVEGALRDCEALVGQMRQIVDPVVGRRARSRTRLECPRPVGAGSTSPGAAGTAGDETDSAVDGEQDGGTVVAACGGKLILDGPRREIRCERCDTAVPRGRQWLELAANLGTLPPFVHADAA